MKARLPEICIVTCLVALAPLVVLQSIHLWERPHFQFFPLAWAACGALIYFRATLQENSNRWRHRLGMLIWCMGVVSGITSALFFSPWIAQAAAILCLTGWGLLRLASVPAVRWIGWTLLLWITLPLPGQADADVVGGLQRLSAESAGGLLDLMGVAHLRQGTLIEIRAGKLFVDEACSGIDSLYSLAAIALLMMLVQERPLVVGLFTFLTVPVWAWMGNVIRLTLIVYLLDRWQIDLSKGWSHAALGFATFGLSSLFLLATLHGFANFFRRFSKSSMPPERQWHLWYNAVVCYPGVAPLVGDETNQYFTSSRPSLDPIQERAALKSQAPPRPINWAAMAIGLGVISTVVLIFNTRNISRDWLDGRSVRLPHFELNQVTGAFTADGFPETLMQAKRIDFNIEHREPESFLGEYTRSWIYRDPRCDFALAIDFPFRGYHPLWVCYQNSGNKLVGDPESVALPSASAGLPGDVVHAKFKDDLGNASYLWFVMLQADGQSVPRKSFDSEENPIWSRLKMVLSDTVEREPVTYQFQLYVPSTRELKEDELAEYLALFESALPMAKQQIAKLPRL